MFKDHTGVFACFSPILNVLVLCNVLEQLHLLHSLAGVVADICNGLWCLYLLLGNNVWYFCCCQREMEQSIIIQSTGHVYCMFVSFWSFQILAFCLPKKDEHQWTVRKRCVCVCVCLSSLQLVFIVIFMSGCTEYIMAVDWSFFTIFYGVIAHNLA